MLLNENSTFMPAPRHSIHSFLFISALPNELNEEKNRIDGGWRSKGSNQLNEIIVKILNGVCGMKRFDQLWNEDWLVTRTAVAQLHFFQSTQSIEKSNSFHWWLMKKWFGLPAASIEKFHFSYSRGVGYKFSARATTPFLQLNSLFNGSCSILHVFI